MSKGRWAALAAVVLAVGCSSGGDGKDDGDAGHGGDAIELTGSVMGPGGLLAVLSDERNASALSVLGVAETVEISGLAEVRAATDEHLEAVARFDDAGVYPTTEATAGRLEALRKAVDDVVGPESSIDQYDIAADIHERFRTIAVEYSAASRTATLELVKDPGLREGLELQFLVSDLWDGEADIVFRLYGVALDETLPSAEDIRELAGAAAVQRDAVERLLEAEREPYRSLIESSELEEHHEAMAAYVDSALNGEQVSLMEVLETAGGESPEAQPYAALRRELAEALETEAG